MKHRSRSWIAQGCLSLMVFTVCLLVGGAAESQEKAAAPAPTVPPMGVLFKQLGLSLYVQGGITYNFDNPDDRTNVLRVFDHDANTFTVDLAQIIFEKQADKGGLGGKIKVSVGETAKFIHAAGLGTTDDPFDLTEAYLEYKTPGGVSIYLGKWVTFHGAEVIEAAGNMNYSRGFLFNYAIPFTHTGFKASYAFSDQFSGGFHLVNGHDNFRDNNKGKSLGLNLGWNPSDKVGFVVNLMWGPEQDDNNSNKRSLIDVIATLKPAKNLTLVANVDYGKEDNVPSVGGVDARWYGVAGYAKYDFNDTTSLTVRTEWFKDKEGARTGTAQRLWEVTITPEFKIKENLLIRPEYRHDKSNVAVFDGGRAKTQDTLAVGVMYTW